MRRWSRSSPGGRVTGARRLIMNEEPKLLSSRWQIDVPSSTDQLSGLRRQVRHRLQPLGLTCSALHDIVLSTHEAVVNAIVHGNRLDPTKEVTVTVVIRSESVLVHIADEGPGFDWRSWLQHLHRDRQDPMAVGGRGVLLMSRLMDRVVFNEAGNVVQLVKRLRALR